MAQVNGCLTTCDRCGKTIFRRAIGEGETDGGFTRWNKFEPMPTGWKSHADTDLLCDECEKEYQRIIREFNDYKRRKADEPKK